MKDIMGPFEDDIIYKVGNGFMSDDGNTICMIRCFDCGRENYMAMVTVGTCAWCRYEANQDLTLIKLIAAAVKKSEKETDK